MNTEIIEQFGQFKAGFDTKHAELVGKIASLQAAQDAIEAKLSNPNRGSAKPEQPKTAGSLLIEAKEFLAAVRTSGKARAQIGSLFPMQEKTLISSSAVGAAVSGVLQQERIPGIVPLPRRKLRIRDLLRSRPATGGQLDFIRQSGFVNAAYPQTEGEAKGESAITFETATAKVGTIAHWIPATRQVLEDLPELQRFVNGTLLYGLKLQEEYQLLRGDGLGDELSGLMNTASLYAATYAEAGDTRVDKIRHAILECND